MSIYGLRSKQRYAMKPLVISSALSLVSAYKSRHYENTAARVNKGHITYSHLPAAYLLTYLL